MLFYNLAKFLAWNLFIFEDIQNFMCFISSRSLLLSIRGAAWGGSTLHWKLNFHIWYEVETCTRYPLTKELDWWRHHFCHVTHVYFTDQNAFLLTSAEFEKWRHQSTSFIKRSYLWKFQVDTTSRSQDITWSLFLPINPSL